MATLSPFHSSWAHTMRLSVFILLLALAPSLHAAELPEITASVSEDGITFLAGSQIITKYHTAKSVAKPYFFPLNAPNGTGITRPWPMVKGSVPGETTDHVHQKSMWFCHGDIIPEGIELKVRSADKHVQGVDFWSEGVGHGKMVCTEIGKPKAISKTHVSVPTKNDWRTADGTTILTEDRTIHVQATKTGYLILLDINLHASVCPITFGDTKEGSMGVRVHDALRTSQKDGGTVSSSNGEVLKAPIKDNLAVWGKPANWHDYSGKIGEKTAGVAIFDFENNPLKSLWHTRAYGLMAANPFGREKSGFPGAKGKTELVKLKKGENLKLRYGVFVHDGDAKAGEVAAVYESVNSK